MAYDPNNPKGHYNTDVKVPESVIEQIRQLGMEESIKAASSGNASPEFIEGVRRFYPNQFQGSSQETELPEAPSQPGGNNPVNSTPNGRSSFSGGNNPVNSTPNDRSSGGSAGVEGPTAPVDILGSASGGINASQEALARRLTGGGGSSSSSSEMPVGAANALGQNPERQPLTPELLELLKSAQESMVTERTPDQLPSGVPSSTAERVPFSPALGRTAKEIGNTLFSGGNSDDVPYAVKRQQQLREQRNAR